MGRIDVSLLQPGQESLVAQIHNRAFEEWRQRLPRAYACQEIAPEDVPGWIQGSASTLWLARIHGEAAGYAHCRLKTISGKEPFPHLVYEMTVPSMGQSKLAVVPEHRHKGVATALLQASTEHARGQGAEIATVFAYSDNAAASALLCGQGFIHHERFYYERYSDQEPFAHDTVYAELDLRKPLPDVLLNPAVTVRAPREDDLEVMLRVFGECSPWVYGPHPPPEKVLAWLREPWGEVTLVAEYEGKAVGAMEFHQTGVLGIPGVLPEYRNRGVGTTLFFHLLGRMQQRGHHKAVADSGVMLQDAIRMYDRLGFHVARRLWAWVKAWTVES